ncbi:hypothetical protein [Methylorubrum extorquens]
MMLLTALRRPRIQPTLPLPELNAISMRVLVCATQLDRKRKTYAGRNVSFYTLSDQPLPVTIGEYAEMCILQIVNFHSGLKALAPHQTQSTYHRLPETSGQINTPDQLADHTHHARRMDQRHLSTKYEKGASRGSLEAQ